MERRERDKQSRQMPAYVQQEQDSQPLFFAPIRVAQSDERIQSQLGEFEVARPLMERFIGLLPGTSRNPPPPTLSSTSMNPPSSASSQSSSAALAFAQQIGGFRSGNVIVSNHSSSSSSSGPSATSSAAALGYGSGSQSGRTGFLKPKDASTATKSVPNGMSNWYPGGGGGQPPAQKHEVRRQISTVVVEMNGLVRVIVELMG